MLQRLERLSKWLNLHLAWIAGSALVMMMVLSVVNIILRAVYRPFGGTVETVGWLGAMTAAFALGYTQLHRGHVAIDIVVRRFPKRLEAITEAVMCFLSALLFAIAAWRLWAHGNRLWQLGSLSETMHVVYYPVTYVVAFGFLCFSLALAVDGLKSLMGVMKG